MNFASFPYLVFLAFVVVLYFSSGKNYKSYILLGASYFFYSFFGVGFTALMLTTTAVTYWTSSKSYYAETLTQRKFYFWLGLSFDLLVFILFKYLHWIDIHLMNWPNFAVQDLLIPLGISFYTFKTLGYCIDLYKRKYAPIESFHLYALSVSFFPQLIAGPIEKSKTLAEQFDKKESFITQNFINGGKLILWGTFKKVVIADSIAQVINPCFAEIEHYEGIGLWIILFGFSYQIYADFSGYSDIAIGSAMLFNIHLPPNFNKPFFSKSMGEFWGRWHITLSTWLKEYVYLPLGGGHGSTIIKIRNIFIIFVLSGIWHGATINYMMQAMVAFVWLIADISTQKIRKGWRINDRMLASLNYLSMILLMITMVIFFRSSNFQDSLYIYGNLFNIGDWGFSVSKTMIILSLIGAFELLQSFQKTAIGTCTDQVTSYGMRAFIYLFMIFALLFLSLRADITFQYYQF